MSENVMTKDDAIRLLMVWRDQELKPDSTALRLTIKALALLDALHAPDNPKVGTVRKPRCPVCGNRGIDATRRCTDGFWACSKCHTAASREEWHGVEPLDTA